MLLFDSLRFTPTISRISSSTPAALIGFQIFLQILFVDSQSLKAVLGKLHKTSLNKNKNISHLDEDGNKVRPDVRIAGGIPSLSGEFPFMAALGWINDSGELKFHGGGMVISPKMVLTAAHCVYIDGKLPDIVLIGGKNLSQVGPNDLFSKYSVVNVTIFPQYDPNQGYDDIAILELNNTISRRYTPICLWDSESLKSDKVTAIGYGLTEFAGLGSQELLKVNLTAFPSDLCEPFFKRQRKFKLGLSNAHICAGDKDGIKDTCQGDSGGPLIFKSKNRMFAVGITSSGQACSGFPPAIYTKIFPYTEWIATVLREGGQSLRTCV